MDVNLSEKMLNKKIQEKYFNAIIDILDKEKLFIVFSAIVTLLSDNETFGEYIGNFSVLSIFYLTLGVLKHMINNKEKIKEISFYRQLKLEIKNNYNLFENVTQDKFDEEIEKIKNIRNIDF